MCWGVWGVMGVGGGGGGDGGGGGGGVVGGIKEATAGKQLKCKINSLQHHPKSGEKKLRSRGFENGLRGYTGVSEQLPSCISPKAEVPIDQMKTRKI